MYNIRYNSQLRGRTDKKVLRSSLVVLHFKLRNTETLLNH